MVIYNKDTNSFKVILRSFDTNEGKVKVKNQIDNATLTLDCLFIPSDKGLTEVKFVLDNNEEEGSESTPLKNSQYIIEVTEDDKRLYYGQLLVTDEEDTQEYKTYKNKNIIKI